VLEVPGNCNTITGLSVFGVDLVVLQEDSCGLICTWRGKSDLDDFGGVIFLIVQ
jgi:hypothetical protein